MFIPRREPNNPGGHLFSMKPCQGVTTFCKLYVAPIVDAWSMSTIHRELTPAETDRIIEMAWEGIPFEAIQFQFGLAEKDVLALMRKELKRSSFNLWRKRVNQGVSQKHLAKRSKEITRFKCSLQRQITHNKISKR